MKWRDALSSAAVILGLILVGALVGVFLFLPRSLR
jgi:mannose/fructose/N-acetylgalactosamine-specific phosphotransferase system component IID